jgi:putative membrane protein
VNHAVLGRKGPLRLADLATEPLIVYPKAPRPSYADQVLALYRDRRRIVTSFLANFGGWAVGTAEVWLALHALGHPVGWLDALLLESVGQAIRGAAFAIPGSLGVQEGGYLLLAPLVGLAPDTALALSLVKRARELALGLPGIVYLHFNERHWRRRAAHVPVVP